LRQIGNLFQKNGFSISYEENEIGVGAIASPIVITDTDMVRRCVGVVSIGAPVYRTSKKELLALAPLLIDKTQALGKIWPIRSLE